MVMQILMRQIVDILMEERVDIGGGSGVIDEILGDS